MEVINMTSVDYISRKLDERRCALGMPLNELSRRANVSFSTIRRVLGGERGARFGTVTAIGDALGVSRLNFELARPPEKMRHLQAALKARKIVGMVQGTSALEAQAVNEQDRKFMIETTINELLCGPRSQLWASM